MKSPVIWFALAIMALAAGVAVTVRGENTRKIVERVEQGACVELTLKECAFQLYSALTPRQRNVVVARLNRIERQLGRPVKDVDELARLTKRSHRKSRREHPKQQRSPPTTSTPAPTPVLPQNPSQTPPKPVPGPRGPKGDPGPSGPVPELPVDPKTPPVVPQPPELPKAPPLLPLPEVRCKLLPSLCPPD